MAPFLLYGVGMTSRIIRVSFALSIAIAISTATAVPAQELEVDLTGTGGTVESAAVETRLEGLRLMARTHRVAGRSVAGVDTESLTMGPLRLAGLARLVMTSPLGVYPWSSALTRPGGAFLEAARLPSGRFGAALRSDEAYVYVMRRSATLDRFGAGGRVRHGSGLEGELAVAVSRISTEPGGAANPVRAEPGERMIHAVARLRGTGTLLRVTAMPILMAADGLPLSGAGVVGAGLFADWLTLDGSLALAGRSYFTGDAKRAAGATAALRMRIANDAGQSLELRSRWRADSAPEQVMSARLGVGARTASGFSGSAEVSHRRTRSSDRLRVSGRVEARDRGNSGWLSGSVSVAGGRATSRVEIGTRLHVAPPLQLTVAAGWAGEWSARVECVLREAGNEARLELEDDGDWALGLELGR